VNDADETRFVVSTVEDLFGADRFTWLPNPEPGAEDFSYVLEEVPGTFIFLSACAPERDPETAPNNHAPEAIFDDAVLPDGALLLAELSLRRLAEPAGARLRSRGPGASQASSSLLAPVASLPAFVSPDDAGPGALGLSEG
jgi:hypothetical protein